MQIISIETINMQHAVKEMENACADVDKAVAAIQAVKQHNDWGCKERTIINDNNEKARKKIMQLRDNTYAFSNALKDATNEFTYQENGIINSFQDIAGSIGEVLSIVNHPIISPQTISVIQGILKKLKIKPIKWIVGDLSNVKIVDFPFSINDLKG